MTPSERRRIVWKLMTDEDVNELTKLSLRHVALAKRCLDPKCSFGSRNAIRAEIEALRVTRDELIAKYKTDSQEVSQ